MLEKIEKWYRQGLWTAAMVENTVKKGAITRAQADNILGRSQEDARKKQTTANKLSD